MASITVRVAPRSGRASVERGPDGGIVIRVRSAPEAGRATREACRLLAVALGVRPADLRLRTGTRSRTKIYAVEGLSDEEVERRLQAI